MAKIEKHVPGLVVMRLTRYLTCVENFNESGIEWCSSQDLADMAGVTSSTVRQDLTYLNYSGTSNRGYETVEFKKVLIDVLGADKSWNMIVVGAGNMGRALVMHEEFQRRGFDIVGMFDSNPDMAGDRLRDDLTVLPMCELGKIVKEKNIDIGIIAVPDHAAQEVADSLVEAGVNGILNMTLRHISVEKGVHIMDVRIISSLQQLSFALNSQG